MTAPVQTIFRRAHESNFVTVGNDVARNGRLSHRARGVLLWLLSYPPDWDVRIDTLTTDREGPAAVRSAIEELEDAGYIVRDQERKERGRFGAGLFLVFERAVPEAERSGAERRARKRAQETARQEPTAGAAGDTEIPSPGSDSPGAASPSSVPPHAVGPFTANRTLQIQTPTNTESSKTENATTAAAPTHARTREAVDEAGQGKAPSANDAPVPSPAPAPVPAIEPVPPQPNAFALWFAVTGALSPYDGEQIRDAIQEFGEEWVEAAIREAGRNSARKWSYVDTVLKNCRADGRFPGQPRPAQNRPPGAQQAARRAASAPVEDPDNWAGKASGPPVPPESRMSREEMEAKVRALFSQRGERQR